MTFRGVLAPLLLVSYPAWVHLAVIREEPGLRLVALACLLAGIGVASGRFRTAAVVLLIGCVGLALLFWLPALATSALVYVIPVLMHGFVFWLFYSSLRGEPLVTRIALAIKGELSDEMMAYTRSVTRLWALLLGALTFVCVALPFLASDALWSVFTNLVTYLIVAAFFVLEFAWRRYRFPHHDHPALFAYVGGVISAYRVQVDPGRRVHE